VDDAESLACWTPWRRVSNTGKISLSTEPASHTSESEPDLRGVSHRPGADLPVRSDHVDGWEGADVVVTEHLLGAQEHGDVEPLVPGKALDTTTAVVGQRHGVDCQLLFAPSPSERHHVLRRVVTDASPGGEEVEHHIATLVLGEVDPLAIERVELEARSWGRAAEQVARLPRSDRKEHGDDDRDLAGDLQKLGSKAC